MIHDLTTSAFKHLTDADMAELQALASRRHFAPNDTLIRRGSQDHQIIIIRTGFVRVEQMQGDIPIVLARLGPGDVLGEMSFIEGHGATADVHADTAVEADVVAGQHLTTLLTSNAGFSARFHRSIALMLSRRLGETTQQLATDRATSGGSGITQTPPTGQLTDRQLPREFVERTRDVLTRLRDLQVTAAGGEDVAGAVGQACENLVALLEETTDDDSLLQVTFDDLLAFRSTEQVGSGLGHWLFREAYPFLMSSATIAHVHLQPPGSAHDLATLKLIHGHEPYGDGVLGPAIDRWFLDRPSCRSRRNILEMATRELSNVFGERTGSPELEIAHLAARWPSGIFDALASAEDVAVTVTCIDDDEEALIAIAGAARRRGILDRFRLAQTNVMSLVRGNEHLALLPQAAIWATGLCEHLEDATVVELLDWAFERLDDGGTLLLSNLHRSNPDQVLMEYLLDLAPRHRAEDEVAALVARSAFAGRQVSIERDETGANMLVRCRKS